MSKEKFETSLERLEKIVEDLESGGTGLEDMLKKYEEGVKLARFCTKTLHDAEKKIEVLSKGLDGDFETEDFDVDEVPSKKKTAKKRSKK